MAHIRCPECGKPLAKGVPFCRCGWPHRNPTYKRYGGREGSAEFRPMTLEEAKMLNYGDHIWFLATDGSARRVKVNGRPQLWKRSPHKIRVPVKYGMYETGQFYEHDFGPDGRVLVPL